MAERSSLLKRALVEFLVIVTGILAAFSVEEFRDARDLRAIEREYAHRIAGDVDDALASLGDGMESAHARAEAGRAVLSHLSGVRELAPNQLVVAAYEVALYPISRERRLGRRTTYDELVSSGNLRTIGDAALRQSLARYYEEYNRVGGRLEDRPPGWRVWVYGLLSPSSLGALRGAEGCFAGSLSPVACDIMVPEADAARFVDRLATDHDFARSELNQMVHYQDRQAGDLEEFLEASQAIRRELSTSGLLDGT